MSQRILPAAVELMGLTCRFLGGVDGAALVEHELAPRTLGAPLHVHRDEDEVSYVLEGELGVQIGDEVRHAGPGAVVVKPRGIAHAFWNRGATPVRLLEVITPAGFESYFADIAPLFAGAEPDLEGLGTVMARYGLEMDLDSIGAISAREGLAPPPR